MIISTRLKKAIRLLLICATSLSPANAQYYIYDLDSWAPYTATTFAYWYDLQLFTMTYLGPDSVFINMNGEPDQRIDLYDFTQTDALLIDANIWLYIYCPQAQRDDISPNYSNALAKILKAKCSVFLDVLILSEFINRYSRLRKRPSDPRAFKSYRQSAAFRSVAKEIANAVRRILKHCKCVESGLTSVDINSLLTDCESKCPDYR